MDDAQPTIRVLLAEDDPLARRAVDNYLSRAADIELIGVAVDGEQAVKLATELRPDVCLVDVHMPKMDGIEVTRIVTAPPLNCRAVCFTALGDDRTLTRAIQMGASGFLLKTDSPALIMHGIRSAYSGDALVSPKLVATLLSNTLARTAPPADLGQIDTQLLTLIGRGLSNAEIGEELHLATSTVKTYVSRLLRKTDSRSRAQLAARAHEWGVVVG